jgi:hypothetical protein
MSALLALRAQFAQQKIASSLSTPWPRIRQPQWAQSGATWAAAHSMLSNVAVRSPQVTVNVLS